MRIKKIIKILRKYKDERGTWRIVYEGRYLQFVANGYQAPQIIRGFIKSVEKEIN